MKVNIIKYIILIYLNIALLGCAHAARTPIKDKGMSALEGRDLTALIEGCGNQLISGYTYCRKTEGEAAKDYLYFVGPITNCKREFCVEFKIYNTRGEVAYGDKILKKKNRASVPWTKLLARETFELGDRGFWPFTYWVYWIDRNGFENVSVAEGEIRLRVLAKEYIPLNEVVNDSNFVPSWGFWAKNGELIKMTTGMRTYVSKRKK